LICKVINRIMKSRTFSKTELGCRVPAMPNPVAALLAASPVVLAPMEDVTDAPFRRICRSLGASVCVTEFVGVEQVIADSQLAQRRTRLAVDDQPTAIQIYGGDPALLLSAAQLVVPARPAFVDLNCGCWVPGVVGRNAGAAWLRDPAAMVEMARRIVSAIPLPVTVKTRIGWGPESHMPIVDLARRLEDAGIAALTIHCRTAAMGHRGPADWSWARRAQAAVSIPVIVNGDIVDGASARAALDASGADGVMVGRGVYGRPWIAAQIEAELDGRTFIEPDVETRLAIALAHFRDSLEFYGERLGLRIFRKHLAAYIENAPWPAAPLARREARSALCRLEDAHEVERGLVALWRTSERRLAA